jgi:signal transduction histidine kinase
MSKILIVEDEVILAKDMKEILTAMGYEVVGETGRGEEAIQQAQVLQPELILMDINLGSGMDGITAAGKIKELYGINSIYLTAYADPQLMERAKLTEPYGYILKPFDPRELQIAIDIALYKHKLEKEKAELQTQLLRAQKMEAIATFAGGIIHEFNNMLWAIMGFTELTLDEVPHGSTAQKNLQHILQSSQRAKNFVAQFQMFSHQAGPECETIQFSQLIEDSLTFLSKSLPENIKIEKHLENADGIILSNPDRLQQMLSHLYNNAIYAMREEGGILGVTLGKIYLTEKPATAEPSLTPGPYFRLTVRDTGQGMDRSVVDRIFEPFFTTKNIGEGKGLGLAMVYGIVMGQGGSISVSSQPGLGTTFTILLPRVEK